MSGPSTQSEPWAAARPRSSAPAHQAVLADLADLAGRRRRALLFTTCLLVGAVVVAVLFLQPVGARSLMSALALSGAVVMSLGVALGVPLVGGRTARLVGLASTVLVVAAVALLAGTFVPGAPLGLGCLAMGIVAGVMGLAALTLSMGKLWRRSIDVRWPASLGATAVVLAVGASMCGHQDGMHLWVAHLPVVPAVYALAWAGSQVVRRGGRLA